MWKSTQLVITRLILLRSQPTIPSGLFKSFFFLKKVSLADMSILYARAADSLSCWLWPIPSLPPASVLCDKGADTLWGEINHKWECQVFVKWNMQRPNVHNQGPSGKGKNIWNDGVWLHPVLSLSFFNSFECLLQSKLMISQEDYHLSDQKLIYNCVYGWLNFKLSFWSIYIVV